MAGLNTALSIATNSLDVFTAGIAVAGNNLANATTPGYIRERLNVSASLPTTQGGLTFGTGANATGIRQQIDKYLESRTYAANADLGGTTTQADIYKQLEVVVNALGDLNLSSGLNEFLGQINNLANQPDDVATKQLTVEQARQFTQSIVNLRNQLDGLRTSLGAQVLDQVNQVNSQIDEIARLNKQIVAIEGGGLTGSDAGALRSQRLNALNSLSQLLPIKAIEQPTGAVDVFLNSDALLLQGTVQHLVTTRTVDRGLAVENVMLENSSAPLSGTQGSLGGLLNGRDTIVGGFVDKLDSFTSNFLNEFNKIYSSGQGTHGFSTVTAGRAVNDVTSSLNAAGLAFTPVNGSFQVKVVDRTTGQVQTTNIQVDLTGAGTSTTLASLSLQLDAVSNLSSSTTADGRLTITAAPGFELKFADDTSGTLAALGINTFFSGTNSRDIGVDAQVAADPGLFATRQGGGPGDGRNVLRLATVSENPITALGGLSTSQYYNSAVASLAQASASESALASGARGFQESLLTQREQISGVSLDEEAIRILQLQQGYQASAKLISTIDQLFTLLTQL